MACSPCKSSERSENPGDVRVGLAGSARPTSARDLVMALFTRTWVLHSPCVAISYYVFNGGGGSIS